MARDSLDLQPEDVKTASGYKAKEFVTVLRRQSEMHPSFFFGVYFWEAANVIAELIGEPRQPWPPQHLQSAVAPVDHQVSVRQVVKPTARLDKPTAKPDKPQGGSGRFFTGHDPIAKKRESLE